MMPGYKSPRRKLTEEQVVEMRDRQAGSQGSNQTKQVAAHA